MSELLTILGCVFGIGAFVVLTVFCLARPSAKEKLVNKQIELDEAGGWGYVSNSRYGTDMFTCPLCGALTVHKLKEKHLKWHSQSRQS